MAFTDGNILHDEPVGAGFHGLIKVFSATLVAGVAEEVKFGAFKLSDVDNAMVIFDTQTTGQGVPDTTIDLLADGEGITLDDAAGGNYVFAIFGEWTRK
jgi:hypothetical protein